MRDNRSPFWPVAISISIAVLAIAGCQLYHAARLAEDVATGRPGWWGGLAPSGVPYTDSLDLPAIQRAASQPAGGCRP